MRNEYEVRGDVTAIFARGHGKRWECLIDTADLPKVQAFPGIWYVVLTKNASTPYCYGEGRSPGQRVTTKLHRLLFDGGRAGSHIDHINHDGLDNRRANLREVTCARNLLNRRGPAANNRTSAIAGVCFDASRDRWMAYINRDGKRQYLGKHTTYAAAVAARRQAEVDVGLRDAA